MNVDLTFGALARPPACFGISTFTTLGYKPATNTAFTNPALSEFSLYLAERKQEINEQGTTEASSRVNKTHGRCCRL